MGFLAVLREPRLQTFHRKTCLQMHARPAPCVCPSLHRGPAACKLSSMWAWNAAGHVPIFRNGQKACMRGRWAR